MIIKIKYFSDRERSKRVFFEYMGWMDNFGIAEFVSFIKEISEDHHGLFC